MFLRLPKYNSRQLKFFLASGDLSSADNLYKNSLDPDQDQQKVCPHLDPNGLIDTLIVSLKDFF